MCSCLKHPLLVSRMQILKSRSSGSRNSRVPLLWLSLLVSTFGPQLAEARSALRRTATAQGADVREHRLEQVVTLQAEAIHQQQEAMQGVLTQEERLSSETDSLQQEVTELRAQVSSEHQSRALLALPPRAPASTVAVADDRGQMNTLEAFKETPPKNHLDYTRASLGVNSAYKFYERIIGGITYVIYMVMAAYFYGTFFSYPKNDLQRQPPVSDDDFTFGLCDGITQYACDPDWRICVCSCCFGPIRWADTVASPKVNFINFWAGLLLFVLLEVLAGFSFIFGTVPLLVLLIAGRQQIRKTYGFPSGDAGTYCQDCCVWTFCTPCAIMQEALQVEFVDPPGMMQMDAEYGFMKSPDTLDDTRAMPTPLQ